MRYSIIGLMMVMFSGCNLPKFKAGQCVTYITDQRRALVHIDADEGNDVYSVTDVQGEPLVFFNNGNDDVKVVNCHAMETLRRK